MLRLPAAPEETAELPPRPTTAARRAPSAGHLMEQPLLHKPRRLAARVKPVFAAMILTMSLTACDTNVDTAKDNNAYSTISTTGSASSGPVPELGSPAGQIQPASPAAIDIAWTKLPGEMRDLGIGGVDEPAVWAVGGES